MDLIEEIKSRIKIVAIAKDFGLQPTHNNFIYSIYKEEKNRSLKLYEKTNSFYCFSSGKGGDVINFYADYKKIENAEAINLLRDELGLQNNGFKDLKDKEIKRLIDEKRKTEIYYSFEKFCDGLDEKVYKYLQGPQRGLSDEIIKKFRLFSISDLKETIDYLLNKFQLDELKACGLFNEKGRFVFYNHQLIIPYLDDEQIIYLRGRNIPTNGKDIDNKYIGLSGQPAKRLFNINCLKKLTAGADILICEGEFDTMIAHQNRYKSIGIPGVNNFDETIKEELKKHELFICFDNDDAGKKGMQQITNKIGKDIIWIFLQKHKDITDYFNQTNKNSLIENEFVRWDKIEPGKKSKLKLVSARDIQRMDLPPIRWVVKDLIPEGLIILAGRPKAGKSFMAQNISLSVAEGKNALGFFETEKCNVLYVALEDNFRRIQDRMHNILQFEKDKTAPANLYYLKENNDLPKLNDGGIEELKNLIIDDSDIKLIIVDTFGRAIADKKRSDNNSYRADYEISSKLQEFAIQNHICVILLHHTKKVKEDDVFDEISGTSGITGAMDTMLVLKRGNNDNNGKLYVRGRDFKETTYNLIFDEKLCCWNVVENEIKTTAERKEIYDVLKEFGRTMQTKEIAEALDKKVPNISKLLNKMEMDKIIERPKYGFYKIPGEKKEENKQSKLKPFNLFEGGQSGKSAAM